MRYLRSRVVIALLLLTAIVAAYLFFARSPKSEVAYSEVHPTRGDLRITVTSTGTVSPEGRIELKPPVPGRLEGVRVKEGQKVRRGQVLAWLSSTERAALLDSARAVSSEEYQRFQEYYKATPIIAPVSGMIILRNAEPGQTVAAADVLLVIADRLQVVAKVDETDIARVKTGLAAEILLDAYPKEPIAGKVSAIAYEAKTVNNVTTYDVETLPRKQPDFMRSGMTANVTFILKERTDVLMVPLAAIQFKKAAGAAAPGAATPGPAAGAESIVLVKGVDGKPVETPVEIGESDGGSTEIVSGLDEKATLLVPRIAAGQKQGTNPFMPMRGGKQGSSGRGRTH